MEIFAENDARFIRNCGVGSVPQPNGRREKGGVELLIMGHQELEIGMSGLKRPDEYLYTTKKSLLCGISQEPLLVPS